MGPEFAKGFNARLMTNIERLTGSRPPVAPGATLQTDPDMQNRPEFAELTTLLRQAVGGGLEFMQIDYREFAITGCWANFNPPGGLNSAHTHPNNYLSGVYYVRTPGGADIIEFTDPEASRHRTDAACKAAQPLQWKSHDRSGQAGTPRALSRVALHSVPVNRTNEERVSIAFNANFLSFGETMSAPLWKGTLPFKPASRR